MTDLKTSTWGGAKERRFRWSKFRFEWGRYFYKTDCMGRDRAVWWEWENDEKSKRKHLR